MLELPGEDELSEQTQRALALYEGKLKAILEPDQNGSTVAIHLDTGDYAVAATSPNARQALRERRPDGPIATMTVGPETDFQLAYRILASQKPERPRK